MSDTNIVEAETFQRNDDVLSAKVKDELLVMSFAQSKYFGLNPVATRAWELLAAPITLDDLVARLTEEYDVPTETCRAEISALLAGLRERGLLV